MRRQYTPNDLPVTLLNRIDFGGECWLWLRSTYVDGYGLVFWHGRVQRVHRIVYAHIHGPISRHLCVCHSCDTPRCCNPNHLWLGTHQDNMRDRTAKGRGWDMRGDNNTSRRNPERQVRGSSQHLSKLSEAQVLEIRRAFAAGEASQGQLAKCFGVRQCTVSNVVLRKTWKHL